MLYDFLSLNGTHYCKNILIKYIDIGISTCEEKGRDQISNGSI